MMKLIINIIKRKVYRFVVNIFIFYKIDCYKKREPLRNHRFREGSPMTPPLLVWNYLLNSTRNILQSRGTYVYYVVHYDPLLGRGECFLAREYLQRKKTIILCFAKYYFRDHCRSRAELIK